MREKQIEKQNEPRKLDIRVKKLQRLKDIKGKSNTSAINEIAGVTPQEASLYQSRIDLTDLQNSLNQRYIDIIAPLRSGAAKDIFKVIKGAVDLDVCTVVISNGSLFSYDNCKKILDAGIILSF